MPVIPLADLKFALLTGKCVTYAILVDLIDTLADLPEDGTLGSVAYHNGTRWVELAYDADGKVLGAVAGVPAWIDAPAGGGGSMTAGAIRDALATLAGDDRQDASTIKNLPTYTLPVASDTILGGVKIPAGGALTIDGSGNLTIVGSIVAVSLFVPWLAYDGFDTYSDGSYGSLGGGISWAGAGTAQMFTVPTKDDFESYIDGAYAGLNGGSGWAGDGIAEFPFIAARDTFEAYADGSYASLSGGTGWLGNGVAAPF